MSKFNIIVKKEMLFQKIKLSDKLQNEFESIYGDIEDLYICFFKLPILGEFKILSINVMNNNEDTFIIFFDEYKKYTFLKKNNNVEYKGKDLFEKINKIQEGIFFKNRDNKPDKVSYDFKLKQHFFEN